MRIAVLMTNTDETVFAQKHPKDGEKFTSLIKTVRPDWDLDIYFHQNSPDTTSANGLFWDELHPSALGHKWIADGLHTWLTDIEPLNREQ